MDTPKNKIIGGTSFSKFVLNYLPNLFFIFFVFIILVLVASAITDALFGFQINASIADILVSFLRYSTYFMLIASSIQWIRNLIQLSKADVNKEVKSKWRYHMFLFFILANADYYEVFVADKKADRLKTARNFLKIKSISTFRPSSE